MILSIGAHRYHHVPWYSIELMFSNHFEDSNICHLSAHIYLFLFVLFCSYIESVSFSRFRATGYGFLSAVSRISAILGNLTFAAFIHTSKALPVLTTAAVLFIGALFSLKLHETKDTLMWNLNLSPFLLLRFAGLIEKKRTRTDSGCKGTMVQSIPLCLVCWGDYKLTKKNKAPITACQRIYLKYETVYKATCMSHLTKHFYLTRHQIYKN